MLPFIEHDEVIKRRIHRLIQSIDFDFSGFRFKSFVKWLKVERGREIVFVPWSLPSDISGAWIPTPNSDYIFFDKNLPYPLRLHVQLHECGHILCGHQPVVFSEESQAFGVENPTSRSTVDRFLLRIESHMHSQAEAEAEYFAWLIMSKYWIIGE